MSEIPRSANLLMDMLANTPELFSSEMDPTEREERLKSLAEIATEKLPPPAYLGDALVYRVVVISLGLVAVIAIFGGVFIGSLQIFGDDLIIPEIITTLGVAAIGALSGLLAPSPNTRVR